MSLNDPKLSPSVRRAFDRNVTAFLRPGDPSPSDAPRGAPYEQQVLPLKLEVLMKTLDAASLRETPAAGWRFLMGTRYGRAAYAYVETAGGGAPEMASLSRGPEAKVALQAAQDLQKLQQVKDRNYELGVLAIPGLYTEAFHLKWMPSTDEADDANNDLVVPFFTAQQFQPMSAYPVNVFLKTAQDFAVKRVKLFKDLADVECGRARQKEEDKERKREEWREMGARKPC